MSQKQGILAEKERFEEEVLTNLEIGNDGAHEPEQIADADASGEGVHARLRGGHGERGARLHRVLVRVTVLQQHERHGRHIRVARVEHATATASASEQAELGEERRAGRSDAHTEQIGHAALEQQLWRTLLLLGRQRVDEAERGAKELDVVEARDEHQRLAHTSSSSSSSSESVVSMSSKVSEAR